MTRPSHAEAARTLLAGATTGSLATIATKPAGYPFVSIVGYALDDDASPLLCLSSLAEHTSNVEADPRASLMVNEAADGDPQAAGRVTLLGPCARASDQDAARERFRAAHPDAVHVDFNDFSMFRLAVESVRYVGGFGAMSWVDADAFAAAEPDPVAPIAERIIRHMRAEHLDALLECVQAFGGETEATAADMDSIDRYGLDARVQTPSGEKIVRLLYDEPVTDGAQVRTILTDMTHAARAALGLS